MNSTFILKKKGTCRAQRQAVQVLYMLSGSLVVDVLLAVFDAHFGCAAGFFGGLGFVIVSSITAFSTAMLAIIFAGALCEALAALSKTGWSLLMVCTNFIPAGIPFFQSESPFRPPRPFN
jgi:hypothetical protein